MPRQKGEPSVIGRNWLLTINNEDPEEFKQSLETHNDLLQCVYWQQEKGESGTEHIQACITFRKNSRLSAIKKLWPRAHVELTHNVNASRLYCQK